jgi:hypothetical protein
VATHEEGPICMGQEWWACTHRIERKEGGESKEVSGPASQPNLTLPCYFWTFWLPAYTVWAKADWLIDCLTTSTLVGLNQRLALPTSLHPVPDFLSLGFSWLLLAVEDWIRAWWADESTREFITRIVAGSLGYM